MSGSRAHERDPAVADGDRPDGAPGIARAIRPLRFALAFLTVLPVRAPADSTMDDFRRSVAWYPLAGWAVGVLVAGAALLLAGIDPGLRAALVLCAWLGLTGFLHFDGWVDCADALLAPRSPARRLEILRDVHAGSFAVAGGGLLLLLLWSLLRLAPEPLLLLALPALARAAVLPLIAFWPAARSEGLAASTRPQGKAWIAIAAATALPAAILCPWEAFAAGLTALLLGWWAARRLGGGLTGDVYGAAIALAEVAGLFAHLARTGKLAV